MGVHDNKRATARSAGGYLADAAAAVAATLLAWLVPQAGYAAAADDDVPYTIGIGVQASAFRCDGLCIYSQREPSSTSGSIGGAALNNFTLSGTGNVAPGFKLTLAGEYTGTGQEPTDNQVDLLLAIARLEFSDHFNLWMGRFFTPSDRQNLDGPFFTNDLTPFVDEVGDWYPSNHFGADNGIAYWGDFGRIKLSVGAFDGRSLSSAVHDKNTALAAARLMFDFWDKEPGYLLRSSTYGTSNVLALAIAGQTENGRSTWDMDGLLDRSLGAAGVITSEFEYQQDSGLTVSTPSRGAFLLASYLLPQQLGVGQLQPLLKYSVKRFDAMPTAPEYTLRTLEANLDYIINGADGLIGVYYLKQHNVLLTELSAPLASERIRFLDPQELGVKIQFRL